MRDLLPERSGVSAEAASWLESHVHQLVLEFDNYSQEFHFFAPTNYPVSLADLFTEFRILYKEFDAEFFLDWIAHTSEFILLRTTPDAFLRPRSAFIIQQSNLIDA